MATLVAAMWWRGAVAATLIYVPGAALAGGQAQPAVPEERAERHQQQADRQKAESARRLKLVEDELQAQRGAYTGADEWANEWAGTYSLSDHSSLSVRVVLAPRNGVVYQRFSRGGFAAANSGEIVSRDPSGVTCDLSGQNVDLWFSPKLYFVKWGPRNYLVPESQMVEFCNGVNVGLVESPLSSSYLLRNGDEHKLIAGMPEVPPEYRDRILKQRIAASVTGVTKGVQDPDAAALPSVSVSKWSVRLDKGTADGVRRGMEFYPDETNILFCFRVVGLDENQCTAERRSRPEDRRGRFLPPKVGSTMSVPSRNDRAAAAPRKK